MMRDYVSTVYLGLFSAIMLGLAFLLGYSAGDDAPNCPTEDACAVDYRDGAWHIVETDDDSPTCNWDVRGEADCEETTP